MTAPISNSVMDQEIARLDETRSPDLLGVEDLNSRF